MAQLNESLEHADFVDEEVFFGPVTDREKKIREQFEKCERNNKFAVEIPKITENDISINDSLYKSFSVEDSKYDSFEDSLCEEIDEKPQAAKHVTIRKTLDKLKSKKHPFYDSLEDVCSLASNMDKCSISCEVENDSNVLEKQHIVEDSLKVPEMLITNKNLSVNDQIHFDEDSLAILELENTFDDSLEEINLISSIEIEEVNDLENIASDNWNVNLPLTCGDQNLTCISRNLFDTSVEIICEKKNVNVVDAEESCDSKSKLFDSLSNSDFKDILKDSLEESENRNTNCKLMRHDFKDNVKDSLEESENHNTNNNIIDSDALDVATQEHVQNPCVEKNIFDTSVQIIYEKIKPFPSSENILNSECNDASEDSLKNFRNVRNHPYEQSEMKIIQNLSGKHVCSSANDSALASSSVSKSVTLCSDNSLELNRETLCLDSNANEKSEVMKGNSLINDQIPIISSISSLQDLINAGSCNLKFLNDNLNLDKDLKVQLHIEVTVGDKKCQIATQDIKLLPATNINSENCESDISSKVCEEFKHTNKNTPLKCKGDKDKSKLYTDQSKLTKQNKETPNRNSVNETDPIMNNSSKKSQNIEANVIHKRKTSTLQVFQKEIPHCEKTLKINSVNEPNSILSNSSKKSPSIDEESITHRRKTSMLQCVDDIDKKSHVNDTSLLQALDLHDFSSFLNESIIQSNDSIISLNLCSKDQGIQKRHSSTFGNESKENFPYFLTPQHLDKISFCSSQNKVFPNKVNENETPKNLKYCSSFKENTLKKTPGTKIPVLKFDNFAVPISSAHKVKPLSVEKQKMCHHSPRTIDSGKRTPVGTPHHLHHYCKVRNTIFSKVPQIVPSKKYMNVQSPVANYIRNAQGCANMKTPVLDPVLRDCMNKIPKHQQLDSPYQPRQQYSPKCDALKSTKRKA